MSSWARRALMAGLVPAALLASACGTATTSAIVPGGDPARGHRLIVFYGCGACHAIGGVAGADGRVGPTLEGFRAKNFIAGRLPNTPPQVERWIESPQRILPGTIMPDLGVNASQARDIAAYLYTQ